MGVTQGVYVYIAGLLLILPKNVDSIKSPSSLPCVLTMAVFLASQLKFKFKCTHSFVFNLFMIINLLITITIFLLTSTGSQISPAL